MTEINKYHNSKIYKLVSSQTDKFYIGSTTRELCKRKAEHKYEYKKYLENNNNTYITSYEIMKFEDAKIELIKEVKCENRKELEKIEGECIKEYHDRILNKQIAGRTAKEYRETNRETAKEYREANKIQIVRLKKEWYETNKEYIKNKQKEYYEANKERNIIID